MQNVHVFVPVFLYAVTMLIFQIKRIISSKKWFKFVVTLFFFWKMPKYWVGRTTLNGGKKMRMAIGFFATVSKQCAGQVHI